ncbi:membrane fusion protein, multidrug efflux system [Filimonas lacunae]|uniref:Membrane fusion protein, multidrug efflux system n=1 Tax=Filimonas lacunae TaxID=477680 RepID=A0A173MF11_9BACT|nr:HlyD family secretion protein [Filimonas lacunae]BAV06193.1 membrane fusion component of tripartite multidrug resistance system [Filimonas lacunae]SIT25209.1 membrane fusion protein, multidrug efflux system [Filimonas lacunae]
MKTIYSILFSVTAAAVFSSCSGEGTDNAQLEADVSPVIPKVNSTVMEIRVEDNQPVKKGDTLVILDDATFTIAVQQAEIALQQAQRSVNLAGINNSVAHVTVSNVSASSGAVAANLTAADAAIESAKAQLAVAERNYERYEKLLQQTSATRQQFDRVQVEKALAESGLQAAISQRNALLKQIDASKYQVANTQKQLSGTQENINLAGLAVKQAQANLDAAKLQLSYCTIVAPVDGIVSKKSVQVGQVVAVGTPLMAVANDKKVWVVANYKETQLANMRAGQEAEIEVDAYPDTTFIGKVESFSQATGARFSFLPADNATGNFVKVTQRIPVKIVLPQNHSEKYPLRAGMSVYVKVKTK